MTGENWTRSDRRQQDYALTENQKGSVSAPATKNENLAGTIKTADNPAQNANQEALTKALDSSSRNLDQYPEFNFSQGQERMLALKKLALLDANEKHCAMNEYGFFDHCGLLHEWALAQIYDKCNGSDQEQKRCGDIIMQAVSRREKLRYPLADESVAQSICDSQGGCNSPQFEMALLRTQNAMAFMQWSKNFLKQ